MTKDIAGWCNGSGQRAAARRYGAVMDLAWREAGLTGEDAHAWIRARFPLLAPALSGLPCPGVA